jgi:hypothetical protein
MSDTLLVSLFTNPKPHLKQIYRCLEERIFPNRDDFINFLQAGEIDERVNYAKKIIRRMCFDSNYPPPYFLLENLLAAELSDVNKSETEKYTAQDHFMHIVNLYLLGIYAFFYHSTLNKALISAFSNKNRRSESARNLNIPSIKDFIRSWKYFCIYHDITYPIEILYKKENNSISSKEDTYKQFLDPFNNISKLLNKEYLIEAMAKLIVILELLDDNDNVLLKDVFSNLDCSFDDEENTINVDDIIKQYGDYWGINKLYTYDNSKLVRNFMDKKDLLSVLLDTTTGNPVGLLCFNEIKKDVFILCNYDVEISKERIKLILQDEDMAMDNKFRIMYFINDLKKLKKDIHDACGLEDGDIKKCGNFLKKWSDKNNKKKSNFHDFYRIKNPQKLGMYLYDKYEQTFKIFNELFCCEPDGEYYIPSRFRDEGTVEYEIQAKIYNKYINKEKLSENISTNMKNVIKEKITENMIEEINNNKPNTKEELKNILLEKLVKLFNDESKNVINEILEKTCENVSKDVFNELEAEFEESCVMIHVFLVLSKRLGLDKVRDDDFLSTEGFYIDKILTSCSKNTRINEIIKKLDNRFNKEINISLNTFLKDYVPEHICYDHGISASLFYLYSNFHAYNIIDNNSDNENDYLKGLKLLIWGADIQAAKTKLVDNYRFVIEQTAYAIMNHNIYTHEFKRNFDKEWITKINESPFSYFCILMDSLQLWNRPKFIAHNLRNWDPEFSYSNYNIIINDDELSILFLIYIDNKKKVENRINELNTYLENCTSLISIKPKYL